MKFFVDLFPLIVFFVAYYQRDMFYATAAVMIACTLQTFGYRWVAGSFDRNHVLAVVLVLPFGAMTLIFQDPTFIKWNGTAEFWLLAIGLIGSQYIGDKPMIERMLGTGFELPKALWKKLNLVWAAFFVFSGSCNLYVAFNFEEATWVNFRLFGMTAMSVVFVAANMLWIMRFAPVPPSDPAQAADTEITEAAEVTPDPRNLSQDEESPRITGDSET